jgi:hypothetical protein
MFSTNQGATWATLRNFSRPVVGLALDPNHTMPRPPIASFPRHGSLIVRRILYMSAVWTTRLYEVHSTQITHLYGLFLPYIISDYRHLSKKMYL